jgi:2,3-bisphosphoglycerate-dependent phosphoglycerate mutase
MATELILIRHGHAVRVNGHYVPAPLTPVGQKQADMTGRYLCRRREHLDGFYSSPLRRARETAARIGVQIGQIPHIQNGVQELESLEVPQLVVLETLARLGLFGKYLYENSGKPIRWPILGRVSHVLTQLVETHPNQCVAVVAHGGVISAVLAWYYPRRRRRWWRYTVDNCSFTRLRVEGPKAELLVVNDTNHLKPEITTAQPPALPVEVAETVRPLIR